MESVLSDLQGYFNPKTTRCEVCNVDVKSIYFEQHIKRSKHERNERLQDILHRLEMGEDQVVQEIWDASFSQASDPPEQFDPIIPESFIPNIIESRSSGGGRKEVINDSLTSKLLNNFYHTNHGKPFSQSTMQELLDILRSDHFNKEDIPSSLYHLKKSGKLHLSNEVLPMLLQFIF